MDQILLTFGSLFIYYTEIIEKDPEPANVLGCTAILDSIEKRWAKADQDVFIAAVILNPFIKTSAFKFSAEANFLTRAGIFGLMKRLYRHFFSITETPEELESNLRQLFLNVEDSFNEHGICADMSQYASAVNDASKQEGVSPDPITVYEGISSMVDDSPPPLFKLAYHILSICPNSASCERLFSVFGNTLTKLRNRLGTQTLTSLAEVKMHIRDEHVRDGETKRRMKRFFGTKVNPSQPETAPSHGIPTAGVSQVFPIPQLPSCSNFQVTPPPERDAMEIDPSEPDSESLAPRPDDVINEFNNITGSFVEQVGGDNDDGDGRMPSDISVEIANLFDFTKKSWIPLHERTASRSLDEELELYELLDLDAPGEEDINIEIDHALDSILHHV